MATVIPVGAMHVVQPLFHTGDIRNVSVTYAVNHTFNPILDTEAQTLINDLQTAFNDAAGMRSAFDSEVSVLPPIGYYRQSLGAGLKAVTAAGAAQPGLQATTGVTPQVAVLVTERTAFVGRAFRGRMFLPWWINEAGVDELGAILTADLTARQGLVDGWQDDVEALASVSAFALLHDSASPAAGNHEDITTLQVRAKVGTQRRRLRR